MRMEETRKQGDKETNQALESPRTRGSEQRITDSPCARSENPRAVFPLHGILLLSSSSITNIFAFIVYHLSNVGLDCISLHHPVAVEEGCVFTDDFLHNENPGGAVFVV